MPKIKKAGELIEGKWYTPNKYKEYYYKYIGRTKDGWLNGHYFTYTKGQQRIDGTRIIESPISNNDFWMDCREATEEEVKACMTLSLIAIEFPEPQELYPIFN